MVMSLRLKKIKIKPRVKLNNKIYVHGRQPEFAGYYTIHAQQIYEPRASCFLLALVYSFDDVLNQNKDNKTAPVE